MREETRKTLYSVRMSLGIYAGVLLTVAASMVGLVLEPQRQLGALEPKETVTDPVSGATEQYPVELSYSERLGRDVYRSMGCLYCHSQQVRPEGFGADIERGWGTRRTVARDYLYDQPHLLGTMRTGPDLANIAVRQPSYEWQHLHLYNPRITSPGSIMPSFPFLYDTTDVAEGEQAPEEAIELPNEEGRYIVPKEDAERLYSYLMTLDKRAELPEAK